MRHTEFWRRMRVVFGEEYARSWASDVTLAELSGRTAAEALEQGDSPKAVWRAVCAAVDVPNALR